MALRKLTPFLVFGLLTVASEASAHMIETNYFLDRFSNEQSQQVLKMQSTYSNGQPLKGAKVNIYSPNNPVTPWAQGITDSEGRFSFSPDQTKPGDWEVVIRQQGHGDILTVPVDEAGVTTELISDRSDTDIHYGSSSYLGWVVSLVTLAGFGLWRRLQK
ncbi:family protein -dependent receptor [Leptolyngbya sp. Heron Island J]|uniref:carboxypeptidase-like regulatory domain-containing protein n=1 Tax=Leptolyngbya sp. Heron Island J TaxID=1385935 RepID=UPI0003B9C52D|nr:carboxypeptidase-like regulatory domain-containing protein [Leptolyngbya sp. Heron Island J]ESA32403.1 family protein -dependent receptor [Leptolyngbya sp. Heron Island J]